MKPAYAAPLTLLALAFACEASSDDPAQETETSETDAGGTMPSTSASGPTTPGTTEGTMSGETTSADTTSMGPTTDDSSDESSEGTDTGSNPNAGRLDPDFGDAGWVFVDISEFDDYAYGLAIVEDDAILVAGDTLADFSIVRLNADGSPDMTWGGGDGIVTHDFESGGAQAGRDLYIDSQDRIVVPGAHIDQLGALRTNPDGSVDTSFDNDGLAVSGDIDLAQQSYAGAIGPNDQVLSVGQYDFSLSLVLFDQDGARINAFGGDGLVATDFPGYDEVVGQEAMFVADDQIVVAGFALDNRGNYNFLARYNADGTLDSNFGSDDGYTVGTYDGFVHEAQSLAMLDDGSFIIAGLAEVGFEEGYVVAKHAADGTLDMTWGDGGYVDSLLMSRAHDIAVDADGSFYLAGDLEEGAESTDISVSKHNEDGSVDMSFGVGGAGVFDSGSSRETVFRIAFHGDDGLILAGHVLNEDSFNDIAVLRVFR